MIGDYSSDITGDCAPDGKISLISGDNKVCTITNTRKIVPPVVPVTGTITVNKILIPSTDPGIFDLKINGVRYAASIGNGGTTTAIAFVPGTYPISEKEAVITTNMGDYNITYSGDCTPTSTGATITIAAGQNKVCTITNTRKVVIPPPPPPLPAPKLTINKLIIPSTDTGKFNLLLDGAVKASNIGNNQGTGVLTLTSGNYIVSESAGINTVIGDYSSDITGDCAPDGKISLISGDNKVCTITNTVKPVIPPPSFTGLIIQKNTLLGNDSFDYAIFPTPSLVEVQTFGDNNSGKGSSEPILLHAGTYTITERFTQGWTFESVTCQNALFTPGTTGPAGVTMGVTLVEGKTTTCIFTNKKNIPTPAVTPGTLEIIKYASGIDTTFSYGISPTPNIITINTDDGMGNESETFKPGRYSVIELIPPKWNINYAYCLTEGGVITGASALNGLSNVLIESGKTTTCEFANTYDVDPEPDLMGKLKVIKHTVGGNRTFDYIIKPLFLPVHVTTVGTTTTGQGQTVSDISLEAGTYSGIFENIPDGWSLDSASCKKENGQNTGAKTDDGVSDIDIVSGQTTTCEFSNSRHVLSISSVNPASASSCDQDITLTVYGLGFTEDSVIYFDSYGIVSDYISETQLKVHIPSLPNKKYSITVVNPKPNNGTSNAKDFTISDVPLAITSLSPTSKNEGGSNFFLNVNGIGFTPDSVVEFNGQERATTYISGTKIKALILAKDIKESGIRSVTVTNSSNSDNFTGFNKAFSDAYIVAATTTGKMQTCDSLKNNPPTEIQQQINAVTIANPNAKLNITCNAGINSCSGTSGHTDYMDASGNINLCFSYPTTGNGGMYYLFRHELTHARQTAEQPVGYQLADTATKCCQIEAEAYQVQCGAEAENGAFDTQQAKDVGLNKNSCVLYGQNMISCSYLGISDVCGAPTSLSQSQSCDGGTSNLKKFIVNSTDSVSNINRPNVEFTLPAEPVSR